jgi:hypothetical protein
MLLEHGKAGFGETANLSVAAPVGLGRGFDDGLPVALDLEVGEPPVEVHAAKLLNRPKRPFLKRCRSIRYRDVHLGGHGLSLLERRGVVAHEFGGELTHGWRSGLALCRLAAGDLEQVGLDVDGEPALVEAGDMLPGTPVMPLGMPAAVTAAVIAVTVGGNRERGRARQRQHEHRRQSGHVTGQTTRHRRTSSAGLLRPARRGRDPRLPGSQVSKRSRDRPAASPTSTPSSRRDRNGRGRIPTSSSGATNA